MEMKDLEKIGRIELKFDQLDGVAGGVITPAQEATLNSVLKQVKGADKSLEEVLGMIPGYYKSLHMLYPDITLEEVTTYVSDVWDTI